MYSADRWARLLSWTTLAGVMCALIGPYGSFIANPINRFCFWVSVFWAGTIILWPAMTFAMRWAERRSIPVPFATGVSMLLACIPLAAFAWAACSLLWPVHASGIMPQEWYVLTFIVAAPSAAAVMWLERSRHNLVRASTTDLFVKTEERERLPDRLLDQIIGIEMEDHHLRAHTVAGSALYYGSMREATAQLGRRGLQVHRGWWVAHGVVDGFKEVDRAFVLELKNGLSVPVARSRVSAVRMTGWLSPAL
jgi:hypothetical protein